MNSLEFFHHKEVGVVEKVKLYKESKINIETEIMDEITLFQERFRTYPNYIMLNKIAYGQLMIESREEVGEMWPESFLGVPIILSARTNKLVQAIGSNEQEFLYGGMRHEE